jgi:hypothetical protein
MSEAIYNNNAGLIANFSHRLSLGQTLTEAEALMYEQALRLHEAVAKNLRLQVWDESNKKIEQKQQEDSE